MKILCLSLLIICAAHIVPRVYAEGISYYIDCVGNDANNGTSPDSPWRTLTKAGSAPLNPGDTLLFKSGCIWTVRNPSYFDIKWNGTATAPIRIGMYGTGNKPVIRSDAQSTSTYLTNIKVTGSHQIIENIRTDTVNHHVYTDCLMDNGLPVRQGWYVGFTVDGDFNTLQNIEADNMAIGVFFGDSSDHGKLLNSYFHDLNTLTRIDTTAGAMGATGIFLHGNDHEIAYNLFERNKAACRLPNPVNLEQEYSAPFEVYNANRTYTHHNRAYGHRKHFEMGKDSTHLSEDNVLAYNQFVSDSASAIGVNIHGNDVFGPVNRTQIYHNTLLFTGSGSKGIIAGGIKTVRNNIIIAEWVAAYYADETIETNNIYWDFRKTTDKEADPHVQFGASSSQRTISPTSRISDPLFISSLTPGGDYHLQTGSPANGLGMILTTNDPILTALLEKDLDGITIPDGTNRDAGAFIRTVAAPTLLPTPKPGDTNDDNIVDGKDFIIWLEHYNTPDPQGYHDGDFSLPPDGKVDGEDFIIWLRNYGT